VTEFLKVVCGLIRVREGSERWELQSWYPLQLLRPISGTNNAERAHL